MRPFLISLKLTYFCLRLSLPAVAILPQASGHKSPSEKYFISPFTLFALSSDMSVRDGQNNPGTGRIAGANRKH